MQRDYHLFHFSFLIIYNIFSTVLVPERDLVAGTVEHAASTDIVQDRCKSVVAIFSDTLFERQENKFLLDFSHKKRIINGEFQIIPVMLGKKQIIGKEMSQFLMYSKIVYDTSNPLVNFWKRLLGSNFAIPPEVFKTRPELISLAPLEQFGPNPNNEVNANTANTQQLPLNNLDELSASLPHALQPTPNTHNISVGHRNHGATVNMTDTTVSTVSAWADE